MGGGERLAVEFLSYFLNVLHSSIFLTLNQMRGGGQFDTDMMFEGWRELHVGMHSQI